MNPYFYLGLATLFWIVQYLHNGRFVRPRWKIPGKFIFYITVSFLLIGWIGHLSLLFIIGHPMIGFIFHLKICRENNIDWLACEPREAYQALMDKYARGEFN